jgi:hypothetical protein
MNPFDDPALRDSVMQEFLSGLHPAAIANKLDIAFMDLLTWWEHPAVQADLARFRELLEAQRHFTTLSVASECVSILLDIARRATSAETSRKAAAQLLRSLGPTFKRTEQATAPPAPAASEKPSSPTPPAPAAPPPADAPVERAAPRTEAHHTPLRLTCHDT